MPANKIISNSDVGLMAQLRAEGLTFREIAEKWEVHPEAVRKRLKAAGAERVPGPFTNQLNASVLRIEREEGEPIRDVLARYAAQKHALSFTGELLGISAYSVKILAAYYGVQFEARRGKTSGFRSLSTAKAVEAARLKSITQHGIEHNGVRRSAQEWSRLLGGANNLVQQRLDAGWDVARAITTPPYRRGVSRPQSSAVRPRRDHKWRESWAA